MSMVANLPRNGVKKMIDLTTNLVLSRSTKNKHLYVAHENEDNILGSVYIEKSALPTVPPKEITILIRNNEQ